MTSLQFLDAIVRNWEKIEENRSFGKSEKFPTYITKRARALKYSDKVASTGRSES
jgi:hypothetical protein